ncbi:MAG: hypothetical protein R3F56_00045 [Planctomycetota bacterium]
MHVDAALSQLSEIHAQLLRSEVFRGYRSRSMATTSGLALLGALVQPLLALDGDGFARFWMAVAALCCALCAFDLYRSSRASDAERARTLRVVGQIAPAFAAGAVLPFVLLRPEIGVPCLLPGLWALVFGLAVFASRPFLPRAVGWVGLWYCAAGIAQLVWAERGTPSPWSMGATFGVGQGLAALVLHLGIERPLDARRGEAT